MHVVSCFTSAAMKAQGVALERHEIYCEWRFVSLRPLWWKAHVAIRGGKYKVLLIPLLQSNCVPNKDSYNRQVVRQLWNVIGI